MPDAIEIRQAVAQDTDTLVAFNMAMASETEGKRLREDILSRGVAAVLADSRHGFYLVAEMGGEVVASLMVTTEWSDWRNAEFWWVQSVYVRPEFRRRGVFRALYGQVRHKAENTDGVCGCRLYVEHSNAAAQATYAKLGLRETGYWILEDLTFSPQPH